MNNLITISIGLVLVFFLTRSWLSEPNLNLLFPLMLIAAGLCRVKKRVLHLFWVIPLVFMMLNWSFPQLFFLTYPSVLDSLAQIDLNFGTARLVARFAVAVFWTLIGWTMAFKMLRANMPENKV
jgi:hypothetical protein